AGNGRWRSSSKPTIWRTSPATGGRSIGLTVTALRASARKAPRAGSPRASSSARRAGAGLSESTMKASTREPHRAAIARRSPSRTTESRLDLKFIQLAYGTNPRSAKLPGLPDSRPFEHGDGVPGRLGPALDDRRERRPHLAVDQPAGPPPARPFRPPHPPPPDAPRSPAYGASPPGCPPGRPP